MTETVDYGVTEGYLDGGDGYVGLDGQEQERILAGSGIQLVATPTPFDTG